MRTHDNPALWQACQSGDEVVGIFFKTPKQWKSHDWGEPKTDFVLASVNELGLALARKGIHLHIEETASFNGVPELISRFAKKHSYEEVFWNTELEVNEVARDEEVARVLAQDKIAVRTHHDQTVIHPSEILNRDGKPYIVFSAFQRAWLRLLEESPRLKPLPSPRSNGEVPTPRIAAQETPCDFPAGETQAGKRLRAFLENGVGDYDRNRDRVDIDATSRLSPYLATGAISVRTCFYEAYRKDGQGARKWTSELIWREFYRYVLYHFPRVCKHQPFREETTDIRWRASEKDLDAWTQGMTGVPIVDAGMRQLLSESWLPNRERMIVAMFLVKDLLLDWRLGEKHFMNHLVDADLASNNGGWQWCASTGNDAAPYFRIMNPFLQSKKCDPRGDYIRRWVPELANVEGDAIHSPSSFDRAACGYPEPIVDHAEARLRTLEAYKRVSLK